MNQSEVFSALAARQTQGVMLHSQYMEYYLFLGLSKLARLHKSRLNEEMDNLVRTNEYYLTTYNRLIGDQQVGDPGVLPTSWRKYSRYDVDDSTRRKALREGLEQWTQWETETLRLYERLRKELADILDTASADYVGELISDVSDELRLIDAGRLAFATVGYDMAYILDREFDC